jgi:hypothetical protein
MEDFSRNPQQFFAQTLLRTRFCPLHASANILHEQGRAGENARVIPRGVRCCF